MLSVAIYLIVLILNVVMLSVVRLHVVAPNTTMGGKNTNTIGKIMCILSKVAKASGI